MSGGTAIPLHHYMIVAHKNEYITKKYIYLYHKGVYYMLSESRKKANKKWAENNKERNYYIKKRSATRNFIKNQATLEDLIEIEKLIQERRKELENKTN